MAYYSSIYVVDIGRVKKLADRFGKRFLDCIFTEAELRYCIPRAARHQHLASRLAAKVAARKALRDAGLVAPPYRELEVQRDEWGKPSIRIAPSKNPGAPFSVLLSLSHSRDLAVAAAVVSRPEKA